MAYNSQNLAPIQNGFLENTQTIWLYNNSAGDAEATVKGAGYFADAFNRKMQLGDLVIVITAATPAIWLLQVSSTPSKASPGATVGATVAIT